MKTVEERFKVGYTMSVYGSREAIYEQMLSDIEYLLTQQPKWISVEERMPESGKCVLLYSPKSGVGEGAWISSKCHFEQWRWNAILTNVTHWMPLPNPIND